jgi:hypothetical protein
MVTFDRGKKLTRLFLRTGNENEFCVFSGHLSISYEQTLLGRDLRRLTLGHYGDSETGRS